MLQPSGGFSSTDVITIHNKGAGPASPSQAGDPAWDAFVAKFRDSSDIVQGGATCVTDAPR